MPNYKTVFLRLATLLKEKNYIPESLSQIKFDFRNNLYFIKHNIALNNTNTY